MTKRIVLASSNPGKVREINQMLAGLHLTVVPQSDFEVTEIEETGLTFVENALLKARNAARFTQLAAIADDSGIEVDALHGAPGIYSARYAGKGAGDKANLTKLLEDIKNVPDEKRTARFPVRAGVSAARTRPHPDHLPRHLGRAPAAECAGGR